MTQSLKTKWKSNENILMTLMRIMLPNMSCTAVHLQLFISLDLSMNTSPLDHIIKTSWSCVTNTQRQELIKEIWSELTLFCVIKCGDPVQAGFDERLNYYLTVHLDFGFFGICARLNNTILSIKSKCINRCQIHWSIRKFLQFTANYSLKNMKLYNHRTLMMRNWNRCIFILERVGHTVVAQWNYTFSTCWEKVQ